MTKQNVMLVDVYSFLLKKVIQPPLVILVLFLISSIPVFAFNAEPKLQSHSSPAAVQQQTSNFRGAELLAYSPKKGSIMIKLQVYYAVFEQEVPEIEMVSLLASNNKIAKEFELQKEIERLDVKPINPESGLLPNPEDDRKQLLTQP